MGQSEDRVEVGFFAENAEIFGLTRIALAVSKFLPGASRCTMFMSCVAIVVVEVSYAS